MYIKAKGVIELNMEVHFQVMKMILIYMAIQFRPPPRIRLLILLTLIIQTIVPPYIIQEKHNIFRNKMKCS